MSDRVTSPYRTIPPAPTTINDGITDHEAASDPHTSYLRADGTRALVGNQSAGGFRLTNIANAISDTDVPSYGQIRSLIANRDPQDAVISKTTNIPGAPTNGDRYIIPVGATGAWTGLDNQITERVAGAWEYYVPSEGWELRVLDDNKQWIYNGVTWVDFGTVIDHGILGGIGDDDHTQYLLGTGTRTAATNSVQSFLQGIEVGNGTTGHLIIQPGSIVAITNNTSLPSARYAYAISAASSVTTDSTTSIADGIFTGQCIEYVNVGGNSITIDSNAKTLLPNGTNFTLSSGESIKLRWGGSSWRCIDFSKGILPEYMGGTGVTSIAPMRHIPFRVPVAGIPNDTVIEYGAVPVGAVLTGVRAFSAVPNTQGTYTLAVADAVGTNLLSAATFDMNTLVAFTWTDIPLTATANDLVFDAWEGFKVTLTSNNASFDGEGIYIMLDFLVTI